MIVPGQDVIRRQTEQIRPHGGNGPSVILLAEDPQGPIGLPAVSDPIDSGDKVFACRRPIELSLNFIACKNCGQGIEVPI